MSARNPSLQHGPHRTGTRDLKADRARFEKLKEAYVKARYSKHYRISEEDLLWLAGRVEELGQAVHAICAERIAEMEARAGA